MVMKSDFNFITFSKIGGMEFVLNCSQIQEQVLIYWKVIHKLDFINQHNNSME